MAHIEFPEHVMVPIDVPSKNDSRSTVIRRLIGKLVKQSSRAREEVTYLGGALGNANGLCQWTGSHGRNQKNLEVLPS